MTKKWLFPGFLTLFLPSAIALSMHGFLGSFSRFMGDDFCAAYIAERFGPLRAVWYWYLNWNGGYSVSVLGELLPLIKPDGMAYVIPIVLVLWLAVTVAAIALFFPKETQIREKLLASLALGGSVLFVILLLSPDVPQSLYWWAGMRPYTMPLITITFYAILYQWHSRKHWNKIGMFLWVGMSLLVTLFCGGLSETFTPVQIVFFVSLIGWNYLKNKARFRDQNFLFQFAGLVGSITALMIMVSAPGNAVRRSFLPPAPDPITVIQIAFSGYLAFLADIFNTPEKLLGLTGMTLGAIWIGIQFKLVDKIRLWYALAFLAGGFVFAFGCFPPGSYGLAEPPPGRTHIIPDFMLVIGFLASGLIAGTWLNGRLSAKHKNIANLAFFIFVVGSLGVSSYMNAKNLYALRHEYAAFAQKWDEAETILLQARQTDPDIVYIPALKNWARVFDPSDNPKFYVNECIAEYYHLNKVIATDNPPPSTP